MTICVTKDGEVIHVGEWDYEYSPIMKADKSKPIFITDGDGEKMLDGYHPMKVGVEAKNPFPDGAKTVDVKLAWTASDRIVLASDPRAMVGGVVTKPYVDPIVTQE